MPFWLLTDSSSRSILARRGPAKFYLFIVGFQNKMLLITRSDLLKMRTLKKHTNARAEGDLGEIVLTKEQINAIMGKGWSQGGISPRQRVRLKMSGKELNQIKSFLNRGWDSTISLSGKIKLKRHLSHVLTYLSKQAMKKSKTPRALVTIKRPSSAKTLARIYGLNGKMVKEAKALEKKLFSKA